ncbi:hypothetical protein C0J52_01048 [Blattella germanica]|nr:hypothetical protein C0J52_01048 [Blattella germanica]
MKGKFIAKEINYTRHNDSIRIMKSLAYSNTTKCVFILHNELRNYVLKTHEVNGRKKDICS